MGKQAVTVEQNNNQTYTSSNQNNQQIQENQRGMVGSNGGNNKNAIYGWRKQCLYFIIFLLMVLISINLALTLWVLKVLEVSKVLNYFSFPQMKSFKMLFFNRTATFFY